MQLKSKIYLYKRFFLKGLFSISAQAISLPIGGFTVENNKKYKVLLNNFDIKKIPIGQPPDENLSEAKLVFNLKKFRKKLIVEQINRENLDILDFFFEEIGSEKIDSTLIHSKLSDVLYDVGLVVLDLKTRFNRVRPSVVLSSIDPILDVPWHSSYPSGHSAQATVVSELMANLFPNKRRSFDQLAKRIGKNREIAGLHYPSDTFAGRNLGLYLNRFFVL
jgi:acid phosphatase (class A)